MELLSDNSPLLIVKNEKQDRHRELNDRQLRAQFTNLKETLVTNLATNRGLSELMFEIKHYISDLPHVGTPLPKTWVRVREALEADLRNYISLDEYLEICQRHGFTQLQDKLQLSGYLHDLGVCLHFQEDPTLKRVVILKPKWGTDAVYKILDNKLVIRNLGRFTRGDLATVWHEPEYMNMHNELLQLMMNFRLCYRMPSEENSFIAPQLLTENQPIYEWNMENNLIMRYSYDFMPQAILMQFIVAMNELIMGHSCVWRSGLVIEKDSTKAEVIEYYGRRQIRILVVGKHKKDLMTIVDYELDKIHASYNRLRYSKLIPCRCSQCSYSQEPHFYALEDLRRFKNDKQYKIQCLKIYLMVDVLGLIDDVGGVGQNDNGEMVRGRDVVFNAPVAFYHAGGNNTVRKSSEGANRRIRSAWANGSFYLASVVIVLAVLGVVAGNIRIYGLVIVVVAAILFVPLIGVLQLRQDERVSEKSFVGLVRVIIEQLPLIGRIAKQNQKGA